VPGSSLLNAADLEHQELEIVQAALAKTPRLAKLLGYLAQRYFDGAADRLTEFNIATQVFGRDPQSFIASEDAIARVETHRLRKKLKLYYETEGRHHPVRISIPLGTYVPVFAHHKGKPDHETYLPSSMALVAEAAESAPEPVPPSADLHPLFDRTPPAEPPSGPSPAARAQDGRPYWRFAGFAGILLSALGIYAAGNWNKARSSLQPRLDTGSSALRASRLASGVTANPASFAAIPFRMIAGFNDPPQKDPEGNLWRGDQYSHFGWSMHRRAGFIPGTNDPLIFQYGRAGDFDYNIPLRPGIYELHLYFLQPSETAQGEEAENKAIFNVALNGKVILDNFDIVSDAMGRNIADERVFRDVSPAEDGLLHLHLSTVFGTPSLSAVALFDGSPGKQQPVRIVTQPIPVTDRNGVLWRPDNYFIGGRYLSHNLPTAVSDALDMVPSERYGHFTYAIPVDTRDEYTVTLYFVELFFGTPEANGGGTGSRIFRVMCNGNTLLDNFDIFKEAGNFHLIKKTFHHIRPTAQGKLNLTFEPIVNYATISAIEVLDESN